MSDLSQITVTPAQVEPLQIQLPQTVDWAVNILGSQGIQVPDEDRRRVESIVTNLFNVLKNGGNLQEAMQGAVRSARAV